MNTFLKPTIFKVIATIVILSLVMFVFPVVYSFALTITDQGPVQNNLVVGLIQYILDVVYWPIVLMIKVFSNQVVQAIIGVGGTFLETYMIISLLATILKNRNQEI